MAPLICSPFLFADVGGTRVLGVPVGELLCCHRVSHLGGEVTGMGCLTPSY